jgi:imidazolonepropionase-like amidohydrolase
VNIGSLLSPRFRCRGLFSSLALCALPALSLLLAGCTGDATVDEGVQAFTNAQVFDGTGAPIMENGIVLVRDGMIAEVGSVDAVEVPEGAEVIDLGGRYLIPGMINAHAHLDTATAAANLPIPVVEQAEIYGYYGVTTLLSLGEANAAALNMRADRFDPEIDHPRIFAAGQIYTPMSADSAVAAVNRLAEQQVDWVKIRVDNFLGTQEKMPPEAYQAVIETADSHNLPVAVHFVELADGKGVLQAGASLLAHSVRDRPVDQEFIDLLIANDVCLVPTLTRELSTFVLADRPSWFDDPFFLERAANNSAGWSGGIAGAST